MCSDLRDGTYVDRLIGSASGIKERVLTTVDHFFTNHRVALGSSSFFVDPVRLEPVVMRNDTILGFSRNDV